MLHVLLTALFQIKKNTFLTENLKLDRAMFSLYKENQFCYVASILCSVSDINSDVISPSQVSHIDEVPPLTTEIIHLTTNIPSFFEIVFNSTIVESRLFLLSIQQLQRLRQTAS